MNHPTNCAVCSEMWGGGDARGWDVIVEQNNVSYSINVIEEEKKAEIFC